MEICHPWHSHPLFLSDEAKFEDHCSICENGVDGNPFYLCVDCKYYAHKSCAQLPVEIQHHFHPQHPLALCFGGGFACDSCHKTFGKELRFTCSACDFDMDVKCATMWNIDTEGKESIPHFTHQHPLTICSKDGDNPLYCFACKNTSSGLIYGCTPCDYFLHKSCAEIPTHVLHALHSWNPLSLVVKFGYCHYCGTRDYTWKYYSKVTDTCFDVSCLIEYAKDDQNERSCFLCDKQHLDSDSCIDSLYLINQSCIQLPEEIKHEFHSHEPLSLLDAKDFGCDSCHKWFDWQPHYGCEECYFRMDVKCALMRSIEYEESDESIWPVIPPHFNHQHPLRLIREVYDINCSACHTTKPSPLYGCITCEYFLHQSCLELPIQIKHPLHDSHVLSIQHLRDNFCHICCRKYDGFGFGCIKCLFFIGIECILELGPTVVHKYHHHLLCLIEKSYFDHCNADNTFCQLSKESSEFEFTKSYSLRCIECDYNLHLLCGPLPCTIKHKRHLHALKLVDSIFEDDSDEHYCDIINVFKKNSEKVELRIVGDLRLEDNINPSHNNLTEELFLDLLKRLDVDDLIWLRHFFPDGKLFPREEDILDLDEQKSSSEDEDGTRNIIEELYFYNDDIFLNIEKRLKFFKPDTKYHIQPDKYELSVVEVEGYKVTSNFATLFRALLMKYGNFVHNSSRLSENVKCVLLYFLCSIVNDMRRTYIDKITEKHLFTWLYYTRGITNFGFDLKFVNPFLDRIMRSYFGLRAMKFENEASGILDREIADLKQKKSDIKTQIEQLKWHRRQHKAGKVAEESKVMREYFTEAKLLKYKTAGEGIV